MFYSFIFFYFFFFQQKRAESPLDATNPFLEEEPGEDVGTEKDEELTKVSSLDLELSLICKGCFLW